MTVAAFILVKILGGNNREILKKFKAMPEVVESYILFGAWDLIIHAEFTDNETMSNFVVDKIKTVEGVGETQTNVCASK
ncbi:MAG: Lrp/AsnC ligand binding domain-containing protein [Candidatus Thorarchaeota archaeon]|jgi:DNA-binding Lrp family transcriptional regulator|nr:Lrp/AsnC ligand binding domain-containing protein [Candidatus Thorarchaeota archaeon]